MAYNVIAAADSNSHNADDGDNLAEQMENLDLSTGAASTSDLHSKTLIVVDSSAIALMVEEELTQIRLDEEKTRTANERYRRAAIMTFENLLRNNVSE